MYVLGINAHHADSSAALIKDGKVIFAIEEERLTRIKHWAGFPANAIRTALKFHELSLNDIDVVSIGRDTNAKLINKIKYLITDPIDSMALIKSRLKNRNDILNIEKELSKLNLGKPKMIEYYEHHMSHHGSSFYESGYDKSICVSLDGSGDFTTASIARADVNGIKIIKSSDYPDSLGIVYSAITQFLGFPYYGDEYKLMGLSPYGKPVFMKEVSDLIKFDKKKLLKINKIYFNFRGGVIEYVDGVPLVKKLFNQRRLKKLFKINPRLKGEKLNQIHKNIAASLQKHTEDLIFKIINHAHEMCPNFSDNLCISGGVAQNSVANGKILINTKFNNLYVPAAGHDAGISIGAALISLYNHKKKIDFKPNYSSYLGTEYTNKQIEATLKDYSGQIIYNKYSSTEETIESAVSDLVLSKVIGWFQGRCEFGPRALGNRSILADPRNPNAKDLINSKIKKRESFRPFAPSVLHVDGTEFFEDYQFSPFMERVLKFKTGFNKKIPSVVHNDNSGRLQSVSENENQIYFDLISRFREKTDIGILVNTSFNENEPVVEHPKQAIDVLLRTDLDTLYIGDFKIQRKL